MIILTGSEQLSRNSNNFCYSISC